MTDSMSSADERKIAVHPVIAPLVLPPLGPAENRACRVDQRQRCLSPANF